MMELIEKEESCTTKGNTVMQKEWYGMMDISRVILLIQEFINTKIANKWVINTYSHSDFAANI